VEQLAPGRLFLGIGTGFTGRMAMGQRPLSWASMSRFLTEMRALLAGEQVEIDGATVQLLHHKPNLSSATPIRAPWLVAANGPKGIAVARELGDGLIYGGTHDHVPAGFRTLQMSAGNAIILQKGEEASSPRVLEAARIAFATQYHVSYEGASSSGVERLPYGKEWLASLQRHPEEVRHLIVHDLHCVGVTSHDQDFIERHPDALAEFAAQIAITPPMLRERIDAIAALGATRISFASYMEPDWSSVLHTYAAAVGLQ
jgi:5,10-methylenetetrahydromethanopterin reductase